MEPDRYHFIAVFEFCNIHSAFPCNSKKEYSIYYIRVKQRWRGWAAPSAGMGSAAATER